MRHGPPLVIGSLSAWLYSATNPPAPLVGFLCAGFALHALGIEGGPVLDKFADLGGPYCCLRLA